MLASGSLQDLALLTAAWSGLYLILRHIVFIRKSPTFSNVVVSYIHAFVAMGLAVRLGAVNWRHPFSGYGQPPTPAQMTVLSVSLAYFVYDAVCCELIKHELANLLHHISTIVGLAVGVFRNVSGHELTACLILMEVSNPCLHSRAIFRIMLARSHVDRYTQELGLKGTFISDVNDVAFALTFFVCRIVLGPFFVYYTLICRDSNPIVKVGGSAIQLVSAYWFYRIVQVIAGKTKKSKVKST